MRVLNRASLIVLMIVGVIGCGRQASSPTTGQTQKLVSESFVDADHGWSVAAECPDGEIASASFACRSVVYKTVDGGHIWSFVSRFLLSPKRIRFADSKTGWMIGSIGDRCGSDVCPSVVMRSINAGKTWDRVSTVSGELVDATAYSGNEAWVVGKVCSEPATCSAEFVRTTTAGQIWDNRDLPLTGTHFRLQQLGRSTGWIGGTTDSGREASLMGTIDGGSTWRALALPCQVSWSTFTFTSLTDGWLLCTSAEINQASASLGTMFRSIDGGTSWSKVAVLPADGSTVPSVEKSPTNPIATIAFSSKRVGWVSLLSGQLLMTSDGGETWRTILSAAEGFRELQFVDETHGWLLGTRQSWQTVDGGQTWHSSVVVDPGG